MICLAISVHMQWIPNGANLRRSKQAGIGRWSAATSVSTGKGAKLKRKLGGGPTKDGNSVVRETERKMYKI